MERGGLVATQRSDRLCCINLERNDMDIDAQRYRLAHSDAGGVYKWLESNQPDDPFEGSEALEQDLLEREDGLIDLGLALFGTQSKTAVTLARRANQEVKRAMLANFPLPRMSSCSEPICRTLTSRTSTWRTCSSVKGCSKQWRKTAGVSCCLRLSTTRD